MENKMIKKKSIFLILFSNLVGAIAGIAAWYLIGGAAGGVVGVLLALAGLIYPLVAWSLIVRDINVMCRDDGEHLMPYICAALLGIITFDIYLIYFMYRMQTRMYESAPKFGATISQRGKTIVIWTILSLITAGIGLIIAMAILVNSFNKLAYAYNKSLGQAHDAAGSYPSQAMPQTYSPEAVKGRGKITYMKGAAGDELVGAVIDLADGESVTVGRDAASAALVVKDTKVSRKHCRITYDAQTGSYRVIDHSTNGTKVNGQRIAKGIETTVASGSKLALSNDTVLLLG